MQLAIPLIEIKAKGFVVRSTARDFPCLAELEWLDLKPFGTASTVADRLDAIPVLGRAA